MSCQELEWCTDWAYVSHLLGPDVFSSVKVGVSCWTANNSVMIV